MAEDLTTEHPTTADQHVAGRRTAEGHAGNEGDEGDDAGPGGRSAHTGWAVGPIPTELGRTALQQPLRIDRSEGMPATVLPSTSARAGIAPKGRTGLWQALTRTAHSDTDALPTISVSDIRRTRSMFDYDAGKALPLN